VSSRGRAHGGRIRNRCPRGNKTETLLSRPTITRKAPVALILTIHGSSDPSGFSASATGFTAASEGFVLEGVWDVLFVGLGKVKAEHAEFPMDSRCTPGRVLSDHTEDQIPNLLRRRSPSDLLPNSGDHPPVHSKASPVPANDSFGCDDEQGVLPIRPDSPGHYPEELIDEAEGRARMSTLQGEEFVGAKRDSREGDFVACERGGPACRSRA
jgi:hypothetical protein